MIKPVISIGKIQQGKEFRLWLKSKGYETDYWPEVECYVDGERVSDNMEAAEIWSELWARFTADTNLGDE